MAHRRWVAGFPAFETALQVAYFSMQLQLFTVVVGLACFDRQALSTFLIAFTITALVTIVVSAAAPAIGGFHHHQPEIAGLAAADPMLGRWHYAHLEALRAGAMDVIPLRAAEGLVQFPSFHTVMAILFAHALWRAPMLGLPATLLNAVVVFSTLSIGGHYLVDVIAGGALAIAVLAGLSYRQSRSGCSAATPRAAFAGP